MKLTIETYTLRRHFGDEKALEYIAQAGFDGIDYSFYWTKEDTYMLGDDYLQRAHALRKKMDELGLCCEQTHAPLVGSHDEAFDLSNPNFLTIVRSLEFSAILGAKAAVVHSLRAPEDQDVIELNVKYYRALEPYCKKYNIKIAVENLFQKDPLRPCHVGRINTPKELAEILTILGSENFTGCLDVGHAALCGVEPETFLAKMPKGMITTLHIQDTDRLDDRHMLPMLLKLNWNNILAALKNYDYQGPFNFEIFAFLDRFPKELLPQVLKLAEQTGRNLIARIPS